jgi:hypothetical protein
VELEILAILTVLFSGFNNATVVLLQNSYYQHLRKNFCRRMPYHGAKQVRKIDSVIDLVEQAAKATGAVKVAP